MAGREAPGGPVARLARGEPVRADPPHAVVPRAPAIARRPRPPAEAAREQRGAGEPAARGPDLPPEPGASPPPPTPPRRSASRPAADRLGVLGGPGAPAGLGAALGARRSTGARRPVRAVVRRRAGSTSPTTASTGTSRPASATGWPSTSRASPATRGRSPTPSWPARSPRAANALTELGVRAGDRVAIYLPMIPEAAVAMLACARIGRAALRRVRRLLRRGTAVADRRRPGQGGHHRRRRLPARGGRRR